MEPGERKRGWWSDWRSSSQAASAEGIVLEVRVERLERRLRSYRYAVVAGLLGFAALGAMIASLHSTQTQDVLRARRVELVTAEGRPVLVLDSDREGGRIAIRSNDGGNPPPPAIFLAAAPGGGSLQIYERGHNFYALAMEVGDKGEGVLKVHAHGLRPGVEVRGPDSGAVGGSLVVFDAAGDPGIAIDTQGLRKLTPPAPVKH